MTIAAMIERLRRIPDSGRSYRCDERFAQLHFGLDTPTLRDLIEAGLPSTIRDGALRFEYSDLHYIGLRLRSASTYMWAVRGWARSLDLFASRATTCAVVKYVPQLAVTAGSTPGVVYLPGDERREVALENGRCAATARVVLTDAWPALPPPATRVVEEVAESLSFCLLPPALHGDTALVRRIGLSDCLTGAHVIVEECRAAGLEARVSGGLLVSLPYSTIHGWPEVRVGDVWVPVDPLMLGVMRDFGGLDAAQWPLDRSVGPMLTRIGSGPRALMTSEAGAVESSYVTSIFEDAINDISGGRECLLPGG